MARTLTRSAFTIGLAAMTAGLVLWLPSNGLTQLAVLSGAAVIAAVVGGNQVPPPTDDAAEITVSRRAGAVFLTAFAMVFLVVVVGRPSARPLADLAAAMFRSGAFVFGGGHVVLPLLRAETVPRLVTADQFLAGYGAVQAMPGPLFTFAAFLGQAAAGIVGALVATVVIFLPGMLLMFGVLPYWSIVRARPRVRAASIGINAAVVGLLAAALINPIGVSSLRSVLDVGYAAALFGLLRWRKVRPLAIVTIALIACPLLALD
jgi:chromate transporter